MEKVDILLPIYNSFKETQSCIESIIKWTNLDWVNIYLLDDNSTDDHIPNLTKFYSEKYPNFCVVRNEKNVGFPENVNNGFVLSENDVIILNSDTVVTENWLESLAKTANLDEQIAAVIPMSNYGIISGLPTANSSINDLFSFEELMSAFQKSKQTGYVEAPLLIGFCMYMKRKALNKVGHFDAATFKRGYGEETDWCMRARRKGLKLAVAKEAYVHHIGGSSFGSEKVKLQRASKEILTKRYPQIDVELENFVRQNHYKELRKNMMKNLPFLQRKSGIKLKIKMLKHFVSNHLS